MERRTFWTRVPRFQFLACIVCALLIGFVLNRMTERSDAAATSTLDSLVLVLYLVLSISCYLGSLWLASRHTNLNSTEAILSLLFVSIAGTSSPFLVNSVHIWFISYQPDWRWFIRSSAEALLLLNLVMVAMMILLAGTGFVVAKVVQAIGKLRKSVEIPGI